MSDGYPSPTRYPVFHWIPYPSQFSFENPHVPGNPKYRVLPDISGQPKVSGTTQYFWYSQTLMFPNSTFFFCKVCLKIWNLKALIKFSASSNLVGKYPSLKRIPRNTWLYNSTGLSDPARPDPLPSIFFNIRPDLILEISSPWALVVSPFCQASNGKCDISLRSALLCLQRLNWNLRPNHGKQPLRTFPTSNWNRH